MNGRKLLTVLRVAPGRSVCAYVLHCTLIKGQDFGGSGDAFLALPVVLCDGVAALSHQPVQITSNLASVRKARFINGLSVCRIFLEIVLHWRGGKNLDSRLYQKWRKRLTNFYLA